MEKGANKEMVSRFLMTLCPGLGNLSYLHQEENTIIDTDSWLSWVLVTV